MRNLLIIVTVSLFARLAVADTAEAIVEASKLKGGLAVVIGWVALQSQVSQTMI